MGGVDVGGGKGGKRNVDQEINMIPFIDLLMVILSFLLITAVWSSMARLNANAQVPSDKASNTKEEKKVDPAVLHVRVSEKDKKFKLEWQQGKKTDDIASIDMDPDASGRFPKLEEAIQKAYTEGLASRNLYGDDLGWESSQAKDKGGNALNQAILHVDNAYQFKEVVKVIDAVYVPRRFMCFDSKPACCGKPDGNKRSTDGCKAPAENVPAFNLAFSSN